MSASVRSKYTLAAIAGEIDEFGLLIDEGRFDEACAFFRTQLDAPTLCGLETSLQRAKLLQQIEIDRLSDDNDKAFVLYSLALSLNLTGGWPNRAIPLYERQIDLLTRLNDVAALSQSLGHYAKLLGRLAAFVNLSL